MREEAPFRSLDDLIGIRSLGGVQHVEVDGVEVVILQLDEQVIGLHANPISAEVCVSRMVDDLWPFSVDRVRAIAFDMIDHPAHGPLVCNFLWRSAGSSGTWKPGPLSSRSRGPWQGSVGRVTADRLTLYAIDEVRDLIVLVLEIVFGRGGSHILPLESDKNIVPNTRAQIAARPNAPFRPKRLIIADTAANWFVDDIKIGSRSQLAQVGSLPGTLFSANSLDLFLCLEVVQAWMDLSLVVTYVGDARQGEPFRAVVLGDMEEHARVCVRWTPEGRREPWMAT